MNTKNFILKLILFTLAFSCTKQRPGELKNSSTPKHAVKESCSNMKFEGQVLSKQNILSVFDCTGWSKQYPHLNQAIKDSREVEVNRAFKSINGAFFTQKEHIKKSFEVVAAAESKKETDALSALLEKIFVDKKILKQIDKTLKSNKITNYEKASMFDVFSKSNNENLKNLSALKGIVNSIELNKRSLNDVFDSRNEDLYRSKVIALLDDATKKIHGKGWEHLSKVIYRGDSPFQNWAKNALSGGDLKILLNIVTNPDFSDDISFFKKALDKGISCHNNASSEKFYIHVAQELKHKIESLKNDSREDFEKVLLHGKLKYLAFEEFCEESKRPQGIRSFYEIVQYAFSVSESYHDYQFLKEIHQVFGEDRFLLLDVLTSGSFKAVRELLIELTEEGKDEEFVRTLYRFLADIPLKDLKTVSELVAKLSLDKSDANRVYKAWVKYWNVLSQTEKKELLELASLFLDEKIEFSKVISFIQTVMEEFPHFSPTLSNLLGDENYFESLKYLISLTSDEKVQKDLGAFFSKKGIFEFIEILTRDYRRSRPQTNKKSALSTGPIKPEKTPIIFKTTDTRVCFNELMIKYKDNTDYYNLVNTLPESCLNTLGEVGFVGQIYLWMNTGNKYFTENYQVHDFHSATGVWAPGMLHFIFSAAIQADLNLVSKNKKKGLRANIKDIHKVLTDPRPLEVIHQFSNVYSVLENKIGMDDRVTNFVSQKSDKELQRIISDGLDLFGESVPYLTYSTKPYSCHDLSAKLGTSPCLSAQEYEQGTLDILRILKKKNEANNSLGQELIKWLHPDGGIDLPFRKKKKYTHRASLDEAIRFLYDLSAPQTRKVFVYHGQDGKETVQGTVIERVEVVIRDIAFLNNFYGAYFINTVAGAEDYKEEIVSSKKLLKLLKSTGGILRLTQALPKDSKNGLKNVLETYDSLAEVGDNYPQANGSTRNYGPFIQSLLAAVASSSPLKTQSFNPYRVPSVKIVDSHNGAFLTKTVDMSVLRHLAGIVRSRFDSELSALDSDDFIRINNHLLGRHKLSDLQQAFQSILDRFLDNDQNQVNLIIKDLIELASGLDSEEQKELELIAVKSMRLMSDDKISNKHIYKMANLLEIGIELWPQLRELALKLKHKKQIFKFVNKLLDGFLSHPEKLDRLLNDIISANLLSEKELRDLINDQNIADKMANLLNELSKMQDFDFQFNWQVTLKAILSRPEGQWGPVKQWLQESFGEKRNKLSPSILIKFFGEKIEGEYRLKQLLDELLINHPEQLDLFLRETFKSLELKP